MSRTRWADVGLAVAFLALLAAVASSHWVGRQSADDAQRLVRSHQVLTMAEHLEEGINEAVAGQRGYILADDEDSLRTYAAGKREAKEALAGLRETVLDPALRARLGNVEEFANRVFPLLERPIAVYREQGFEAARKLVVGGEAMVAVRAFRDEREQFRVAELARAEIHQARVANSRERQNRVNVVLMLFALLCGGGSAWQLRREARRRADAERTLLATNVELEHFTSAAAHDQQEPLRKILAFGELLQAHLEERRDAEGQRLLDRVLTAAQRNRVLLADLLSLAGIAGETQPRSPVDLGAVMRDVLADLEDRLRESAAEVEVEALPALSAYPGQIRQLLLNLVANAVKFRRPGVPPRLKVSARQLPGASWEITVADNGIGFDEQYGEAIFQPMKRLHARHEFEGSGLGLYICRKIAEYHGGRISARGRPGEGAEFTVVVPPPTERAAT